MKPFVKEILVTADQINQICQNLGARITNDYKNKKLVLIGLLKGCNPFLSDLAKCINLNLEIHYLKVKRDEKISFSYRSFAVFTAQLFTDIEGYRMV